MDKFKPHVAPQVHVLSHNLLRSHLLLLLNLSHVTLPAPVILLPRRRPARLMVTVPLLLQPLELPKSGTVRCKALFTDLLQLVPHLLQKSRRSGMDKFKLPHCPGTSEWLNVISQKTTKGRRG